MHQISELTAIQHWIVCFVDSTKRLYPDSTAHTQHNWLVSLFLNMFGVDVSGSRHEKRVRLPLDRSKCGDWDWQWIPQPILGYLPRIFLVSLGSGKLAALWTGCIPPHRKGEQPMFLFPQSRCPGRNKRVVLILTWWPFLCLSQMCSYLARS